MGEIDFGRPRWRDEPAPIVQTIQNYLQLEDPSLAPDAIFERGAAEAKQYASELIAQVRSTRFGAIRARLLGGTIQRMRLLPGRARSAASAAADTSSTVTSVNPALVSRCASREVPPPASMTALSLPAGRLAAASVTSAADRRGSG